MWCTGIFSDVEINHESLRLLFLQLVSNVRELRKNGDSHNKKKKKAASIYLASSPSLYSDTFFTNSFRIDSVHVVIKYASKSASGYFCLNNFNIFGNMTKEEWEEVVEPELLDFLRKLN